MSDSAARAVDSNLPHVPIRRMGAHRAARAAPAARIGPCSDHAGAARFRRERVRLALSSRATVWPARCAEDRRRDRDPALQLGHGPLRHFHTLTLDSVYSFRPGAKPVFHPTAAPSDEELAEVVATVWRRVARKIVGHRPSTATRRLAEDAPVLEAMEAAAARGLIGTGPRRGCRIVRVRGLPPEVEAFVFGRGCAQVEGFNLQAATRIAANDRAALERMCRYLARPPITNGAYPASRTDDWS
jgi:hypothetical protein